MISTGQILILVIGGETKKTRTALVVSNDIGNEVATIVIIAPITSKIKTIYPFEVKVSVKGKIGKTMINQCRAVDKSRLTSKIDEIDHKTLKLVDDAIKIVFGLS